MDNIYEKIIPWNGANDTGKDVRLKLERNFAKIGLNFNEVLGKLASADELFALIAEELENRLSKKTADTAAKVITFLEGLISQGLITAEGGVKLPSGAVLYSMYEDGSLAFDISENGFVIYEKGTANKWSVITHTGAEFQNLVIKLLAQITDLEVSNKTTTLNLLVKELAGVYNLAVSNVATLFRTIIKDYVSSETFIAGLAGEGFKLYKALSGDWNLELDNLTIRKAMTIFELIISKIRAVNGGLVVSQANGRVKSVNEDTTNYVLGIEGNMTFEADDFVRCQVFGTIGAKYYWARVVSISGDSITIPKSEFPAGTVPTIGDDLVQMGNKTNTARQGILYLTASEDGKPRFSVLNGVDSTDLTGKNKLILGCLDGITDSDFPSDAQPSGYGLWAVNVFLKGLFILRNGKSVEDELSDQITAVRTAFEIREGQISSKVTEATVAATNAGNSAILAQGYANTAGSKATDASNSASAAAGSATTAGQKAAAAAGSASDAADAADSASEILSEVTTKESSINQTASNITLQVSEVTTKVTTATNAANTATSAASAASTSATNAKTSETNAEGSASTASSKATAASGSASAAANSATSAAGSASDAADILTTVTQKETSINQTAQAIELKAVRAESAAGRAENAESSINLKADGIVLQASNQAAQTAVNGVQIGGRNLLIGSSNGNGWGYETRNGTEFSINRASTGETGYIYSGYFQLQGNQVYTLSFESKEDAKITRRVLYILSNAYQSNNAISGWEFAKGVDWHKVIITFTTDPQFNGVSDVRLRIDHNGSSDGSSATIFVRNVKLEIGNKATDWTPAPEDVAQDASDKASAAESNAKTYTQQNYASISLLNNSISLLATKEIVNSIDGRLQSAEAKITPDAINLTVKSQTQTIAQQAVDGVQVGGRNYYSNYSTTLAPILGSPYFEKNNINTPNGIYMVGDSSGSSAIRLYNVITNNGYWTISFDIKGSQSAIVGFDLEINDVYISKVLTTEDNNWVHKSYTLNVTNYSHDVYNFVDFQYINFAYIFLKNIKIEYGNKPTDWTPAPEDVDASIALRPTTDEIKSQFTMDQTGISMIGKKIAFTGLMTFSSLAGDAQNKITTAQNTADAANSTAGSALSSANAANTDLSTLKGNLGSLAYLSTVSLAKLDTTIVEGGYIKTSLIDAASVVTGQLIANLINATDITTGRLTVTDGSMLGGLTVSGNSLTNAGFNNDATIILRNDYYGIFSAIGTNTLPTSSGLRAVARFENNNTKGGIWGSSNYAMIVGATGANNNIAVSISGGYISRMARKVQIVTNLSTTIDIEAGLVIVITNLSGDVNLYLPTTYTHDDGHTIKIKNARTSGAVRITAGYGYQTDGTYSHNAIMYDRGSVGWDNALALSTNGDATEIIYCRDITSNGYRGIWMQFKNPRDW